jgi:hypothetical protein
MQALKFVGIPVFLNGQNYYFPSLSTRVLRERYAEITAPPAEGETLPQMIGRYIPLLLLALNRNYPEVTAEELEDWLDANTFAEAVAAMQGASGIAPVPSGE